MRAFFEGIEMDEFPKMLYKAGGPDEINGNRFSTLIVGDEDAQESAIAEGWHLTTVDAIAPKAETEPEDNSAPTRAELEQKAEELGIKFDGRTGDKKLGEMIEKALKG